MKNKDDRKGNVAKLRKRAEEVFRRKEAQSPKTGPAQKPGEVRRTLQELSVHQIELEMQNDELCRAQAELDSARARYFELYDLAPVGYLVVSEKGLILEANLTAAALLGAVRGTLAKRPFTRFISREDQDSYYLHRKLLFRIGAPQVCELRLLKKDGTIFWARLEATVAQDADGAPVCRVAISDISERKKAEAALRASEERYSAVANNSNDAICILDTRGRFQWVNERMLELGGHSREEYSAADSFLKFIAPESLEAVKANFGKFVSGLTFEPRLGFSVIRADGQKRLCESYSTGFRDKQGRLNLVVTISDITDQQRLEAQLRQSQKMETVGLLAGGIAHDFNNILTAIKCYAEFVQKDLPEKDPKLKDTWEILNSVDRAIVLTRQLLAFSRRQIMALQVVDINGLIGNMTNMLRRIIGEEAKLETRLFAAPCQALVDPGQMEQVIMNLAVNARDAMPGGGVITLATSIVNPPEEFFALRPELARGPLVCLKISDTGCGIAPENKARIFEPFFTSKAQGKGTGLGLSTVFGIIKQ